MYFHWQNLNDKPGNRQGSPLRHGRAWLHLGPRDRESTVVGWEWVVGGRRCAAEFNAHRSDGVGVQLSFAIPLLLSLYLTLDGGAFSWLAQKLLPADGYEGRQTSIRIFDWAIWWEVWTNPMEWSSRTPKWRNGCWHVLDTLLGKQKYVQRELSVTTALIPMPERSYPCTITLREDTWKRPLWFPQRLLRANVDLKANPIPVPGKGENSWDCGEDATWGLSCQAATVEEAIAATVERALGTRRRHGGSVEWKPEM